MKCEVCGCETRKKLCMFCDDPEWSVRMFGAWVLETDSKERELLAQLREVKARRERYETELKFYKERDEVADGRDTGMGKDRRGSVRASARGAACIRAVVCACFGL